MSIAESTNPRTTHPRTRARRRSPEIPQCGWLHLCNGLDPVRDGGMVPSILGMTGALASRREQVVIASPNGSDLGDTPLPAGVLMADRQRDLAGFVRRSDAVHIHGLWQGHSRRGAAAARRHRVPYLIAAHGMAEPWALRHKRLKKRAYLALVEGRNLRLANCLHALSRPEVGHLRALAPRTPIALIPNGVALEPFEDLPARSALESTYPELAGKFLTLFLARLHVKKGLDLLAGAIGRVARDRPDFHLLLAGKDDGAKSPFLAKMAALGLTDRVTYLGHIGGESARIAWGAADAFTLPSYSEGFSMAILEALAARKPVLATNACHFPELAEAGAGLVVEPTAEGVTAGLRDLLAMSAEDRASMSDRGRRLVEARYTWTRQADRLAEVYRWLAGGGPKPEAVVA